MKPDSRFVKLPKDFWAHIRTISQIVGYTERGRGSIKVPTIGEIGESLIGRGMSKARVISQSGRPSEFGRLVSAYFKYRANVLNKRVEPRLMDAKRAKEVFNALLKKLSPSAPIPMNKQKGAKKVPAYLTAIVNMIVEANAGGLPCDYDPRTLTTITRNGAPLRTFARRIDGAFPSAVDPVAIWEVKEYYFTTTFGSRVADAVYETLLDGMELKELREHEDVDVKHYLMLDAHYTWWECGRSYLCRILDLLHMGYVDEVLFGYEVVERLPSIVRGWVRLLKKRQRGQ